MTVNNLAAYSETFLRIKTCDIFQYIFIMTFFCYIHLFLCVAQRQRILHLITFEKSFSLNKYFFSSYLSLTIRIKNRRLGQYVKINVHFKSTPMLSFEKKQNSFISNIYLQVITF